MGNIKLAPGLSVEMQSKGFIFISKAK